jgi:hypothetical protein
MWQTTGIVRRHDHRPRDGKVTLADNPGTWISVAITIAHPELRCG